MSPDTIGTWLIPRLSTEQTDRMPQQEKLYEQAEIFDFDSVISHNPISHGQAYDNNNKQHLQNQAF